MLLHMIRHPENRGYDDVVIEIEWRKYCRKNAELVHTRRREKGAWKVKLKERDPEGEDTAKARAKRIEKT